MSLTPREENELVEHFTFLFAEGSRVTIAYGAGQTIVLQVKQLNGCIRCGKFGVVLCCEDGFVVELVLTTWQYRLIDKDDRRIVQQINCEATDSYCGYPIICIEHMPGREP